MFSIRSLLILMLACCFWDNVHAEEASIPNSRLSPEEASRAIQLLEDPNSRADILTALKALAQTNRQPVNGAAPAKPDQQVQAAPAGAATKQQAPQQAAADKAAKKEIVPLEENGLIAQVLRQAGKIGDSWRGQTVRLYQAALDLPRWWGQTFRSHASRERLWKSVITLLVLLGIALAAEWATEWALVRPRRTLAQRAEAAEAMASQQAMFDPKQAKAELIEHRSLSIGRRLPWALATLVLDLVPVALFFGCSTFILYVMLQDNAQLQRVLEPFINAYLTTRITLAILALLIAPNGVGLQLLTSSQDVARILLQAMTVIISTATFGVALSQAVLPLGAGPDTGLLVVKVMSFFVHLFTLVMILRLRKPLGQRISASEEDIGKMAYLRNLVAQMWWIVASLLVVGSWLLWSMGVEGGFPRLLRFMALSIGILAASRLVAALVLGSLSKWFPKVNALLRSTISVLIGLATVFALLQAWGFNVMAWFAPNSVGWHVLSSGVTIVIAIVVGLFVWRKATNVVEHRCQQWADEGEMLHASRLRTLMPMFRTLLLIIIGAIVLLTALSEVGINIAPLLAGASIFGVALGFGSQKLVQDFITGIFLLMENAMKIGDFVTLGGVTGTVEDLSIRTVRIRDLDGSLHIVPFSGVANVTNTNRGQGNAPLSVDVAFESDINMVMKELMNVSDDMRKDPVYGQYILEDLNIWGVNAVDGSKVSIVGQLKCLDTGRWATQREFYKRIVEHFRRRGIKLFDARSRVLLSDPEQDDKAALATPNDN